MDEVPVWTRFVLAGRVRRRAETRNSNHRRWPLAFDCEFCPGRSLCGLPGNCGKRNSTEGMPHRLLTPEALPACAEFSSASQGFTQHGPVLTPTAFLAKKGLRPMCSHLCPHSRQHSPPEEHSGKAQRAQFCLPRKSGTAKDDIRFECVPCTSSVDRQRA